MALEKIVYFTCSMYGTHMTLYDHVTGDSFVCREDEFACKEGGCIPRDKACDQAFDCMDKSDENKTYCKGTSVNMVLCMQFSACIYIEKEDEKKKCKEGQFECDNGNCINIYYRCDGDDDCRDGSDEDQSRCLGNLMIQNDMS